MSVQLYYIAIACLIPTSGYRIEYLVIIICMSVQLYYIACLIPTSGYRIEYLVIIICMSVHIIASYIIACLLPTRVNE